MKHVEKVVALVLLLVLASSCVSSAVQAFTTVAKTKVCVHPEDFKVGVGEVFEVYINVCDVSGLQGFDFMLKYDTDVLDCVALEEGTFLSSFGDTFVAMQEINDEFTPEHGRVWLAVAILGKGYADGSGILAVIRFNATAVGESVLDLYSDYPYRPDEVKLTTCGSEAISNAAMDGHVVVDCCSNDPDPPDDPVDSGVPVAKFKYSPLDPEVYDAVTFDASLSYDPDGFIFSYTWNFGDGNTTTLRSSIITHHFSTRGSYNVNLTVKDNPGLTNSTVEPIQVRGRASPDVNDDGFVDIRDLAMIARAYGSSIGNERYDAKVDLDENGLVDVRDIAICARVFGERV